MDNVNLASECFKKLSVNKGKTKWCALKIDMAAKAFDRVEWNYLIMVMKCLGFYNHLCQLVYNCLSTSSLSVLVNGVPFGSLVPTRGIRQGDPLWPYLFILASEGLTRMLHHAERNDLISGLKVARTAPSITYLMFADGLLIFSKASLSELGNLLDIPKQYELISGQIINLQKSSCHLPASLSNSSRSSILQFLKMSTMRNGGRYLVCLCFGANKKRFGFNIYVRK